jgi:SAM-dependent methyltransferase
MDLACEIIRGFSCDPPEDKPVDSSLVNWLTWPYSGKIVANPDAKLSYRYSIAFTKDPDLARRMDDSVLRGYWNTLVHYAPKSGFRPPRDKKITVLDLGCGTANYAIVLKSYFEGNRRYLDDSGEKVRYIGVDIEPKLLNVAREIFRDSPGYRFIEGDARYLDRYPEIPPKVEVVILRHPGPFLPDLEGADVWPEIFQAAIGRVKKNGFILFTHYAEAEKDELLKILAKMPQYKIVLVEKNPYGVVAGTSNHPDYKFDQYVVLAQVR